MHPSTYQKIILLSALLFSTAAPAETSSVLREDLQRILSEAHLPQDAVTFSLRVAPSALVQAAPSAQVRVLCEDDRVHLEIASSAAEQVSSFYYALHRLGFLFPHPRMQISPGPEELRTACGSSFTWRPSLSRRGFHLHTEHPSEWVTGFYEYDAPIARDTILWMARNFQNVLQIQMIRAPHDILGKYWKTLYPLMHDLQIEFGLVVSFSSQQQRNLTLIPFFSALTGFGDEYYLRRSLSELTKNFDFDYISLEFGTSEFTSTQFDRTLRWLNLSCDILRASGKKAYAINHVSTGQTSASWGNFNFLSQYAAPCLGSQVHTVMAYGLQDKDTPVYGRKDFSDLKDFALKESRKRSVWYYPETSYFVGMDIDMPIFWTDYLIARAQDYAWASENNLEGHVAFSTGQEMGYWLFDWNVALNANKDYVGDPEVGLRLLGEDAAVWKKITDFQTRYLKINQAIQMLTTSNLLDEMSSQFMIHKRNLIRDVASTPVALQHEVAVLSQAVEDRPDLSGVKNPELKNMLAVTWLRIEHAYYLRMALSSPEDQQTYLESARQTKEKARALFKDIFPLQRYRNSLVFQKRSNPTSYGYGYGWVAMNLYFWTREEEIIRRDEKSPFFMNLYNPFKMIFN